MVFSHELFSFGVFLGAFDGGASRTSRRNPGVNKIAEATDVPSWALAAAFNRRIAPGDSHCALLSFPADCEHTTDRRRMQIGVSRFNSPLSL
jgi:hypothetical protein